jgi:integrase
MPKRRSRGEGGLYWSPARQRWFAEVTTGWSPAGKRIVRTASRKTKTEAKNALSELLDELDEGNTTSSEKYTVEQAVQDWLQYGLNGRSDKTVQKLTILAKQHVIPSLGARMLKSSRGKNILTPQDVDAWMEAKAEVLATRTLRDIRSILSRSIRRAQKREGVKRNVVLLCDDLPAGQEGRRSKSLTVDQAVILIDTAERDESTIGDYIVVSLVTGARTEEMRPLKWTEVDRAGKPDRDPPVPPHMNVWRSVRAGSDTKTRKSRRSVALPQRGIDALDRQAKRQEARRRRRERRGMPWEDNGLVFASDVGTELSAGNARRGFRRILEAAGLDGAEWTPRELRHSFVSLLSDSGLPIDQISNLVGHTGTTVTELVYRHQIRPVIQHGAEAMDRIFPVPGS